MIQIFEIGSKNCPKGNLYHSPKNQLRRMLGKTTQIYCGGVDGGTVRDESGKCWDWWPTKEVLEGNFRKIRIVPAR